MDNEAPITKQQCYKPWYKVLMLAYRNDSGCIVTNVLVVLKKVVSYCRKLLRRLSAELTKNNTSEC